MRILIALTYYRPHYSGLTIYVERLARALVTRGHQVTILTSRYDKNLSAEEISDGLEIRRLDVFLRISKGVIMPALPAHAWRIVQQADVINLHVPQFDAAPISLISRINHKPVVLTYHCDLHLPRGWVNLIANQVSHLANHISAREADVVVTNTRDYAENSRFLHSYLHKLQVIPPPVILPTVNQADLDNFCRRACIEPGERIIGMAARLAAEKGVEYLLQAMPRVLGRYPTARVLFVGQYQNVFGEADYAKKLAPMLAEMDRHWTFLGILPPREFAAFLHRADVTVLPSLNSTESFGMVQVESMICGTPVIATDLPGVRQPVRSTGMGRIVPPADQDALAQAINAILADPKKYHRDPGPIAQQYAPEVVAEEYERLFHQLTGHSA